MIEVAEFFSFSFLYLSISFPFLVDNKGHFIGQYTGRRHAGIVLFELFFYLILCGKVFLKDQPVINEGSYNNDTESDSFHKVNSNIQRLNLEVWVIIST